jgi:hypothetical protein
MRLNVTAFSLSCGLIWAAAVLVVAVTNAAAPGYGRAFLELAASVYPGYHPGPGVGSIVTGTLYALVDSAVGGALFAWLYNALSRRFGAA